MEYLFELGFLSTRGAYYMDGIVVYLILLPFLVAFSILLAIQKNYKLHRFFEAILFILTTIALALFHYGIYMIENFEELMNISSISYKYGHALLMIQTVLSILTMILWLSIRLFAIEDRRRKGLPGLYSRTHKSSGRRVFLSIVLTTLSTAYLYWILFIA